MKIVVVGTGFSGSIMARKIAEEFDLPVTVVEKRANIGGNMYDSVDENGILIQRYGPHFINTDKYWIIDYLSSYAQMVPYNCSLLSHIDGRYVRLPFNFTSVQQLLGGRQAETTIQAMRREFAGRDRVPMQDMLNSNDPLISSFAQLLYEKAFKTYSAKQWGLPIEQIDISVINRVQFCIGYDARYLNKDFQYLPENGFTELFENMLRHKNIDLRLNTDANDHIRLENGTVYYDDEKVDLLIYTGGIDELFGQKFGALPYRTLEFKYEYFDEDKHFPCEIISYPQADGYTRSTEYKWFSFHCTNKDKTVVVTEYPHTYQKDDPARNVPCYPVINEGNQKLYNAYLEEAGKYEDLFLCGRLAEYKYYNMDLVIESTFAKYEDVKRIIMRKLA